jgi:two-component system heavy metal sensor histidine kinase CusS
MCWSKVCNLSRTIAFRMGLSFAVASAAILLVLSYGLYSLVSVQLTRDDQDVLSDAASLLRITLSEQDNSRFLLNRQLPEELNAFHYNHYQVRLVSKRNPGYVVFQSSHFPTEVIPYLTKLPIARERFLHINREHTFLVLQVEGEMGERNPQPILIQTVLETTARFNTLSHLKQSLTQLVVVGVLLFSMLGLLVVRLGLRPLHHFSLRIQGIKMDSLDSRIQSRDWPQELGPLAEAFNRLMVRLQKDVDQLTRFSGDLAHELRTPITNLRVETEVLLEKARTVEEYRQVLEENLHELERLSQVIERILLLAKVDSPQFSLDMAPIQVAPLAVKLFDFYALLAEEKDIKLSIEGDLVLTADKLLVEQALGNLLSNALKYTPPKGCVWVSAQMEKSPTGEPMGVIQVADDGPGISADHLPHIFERFYRVDSSGSQVIQGDGLGLAIVKAIMEAHQGWVDVESEPGNGSKFLLRFPMPSR